MKIRRIESRQETQVKKVAAYARVSTSQENQEESFETQVMYFTEFIQSVPNWKLVKVYSDEGISGLCAEKRPGFMQMVADAEAGKIDLILVKSISRFGRNSLEAQTYMHRLKERGVEIRFEREEISSFNPQAEMVFNFLVTLAQEESKSISQNIRWTYEKNAKRGIRHLGNNRVLGYDEVDGKLTPNQDAPIVRVIFEGFDAGMNLNEIRNLLRENEIRTLRGKDAFSRGNLRDILKNEIYKGDRLLQKQPHINYLTHKPDPDQPYTSHYLEGDHQGIVSVELWERVNKKLAARQELYEKGIGTNGRSHFLSGRVYCGNCGERMRIKYLNYKGKYQKMWKCGDRLKGKKGNGCKNDAISDEELLSEVTTFLGMEWDAENPPEEEAFDCIERIDILSGKELRITLKKPEKIAG